MASHSHDDSRPTQLQADGRGPFAHSRWGRRWLARFIAEQRPSLADIASAAHLLDQLAEQREGVARLKKLAAYRRPG